MDAETPTPTPPSPPPSDIGTRLEACAAAIRTNALEAEALLSERNALWAEGSTAGVEPAELGRPFGLQAQTVRWNLNKRDGDAAPKAGQARHRGKKPSK